MKIIGKVTDDVYLCEVRHTELEKFLGLYYNNLKKPVVGTEFDLGKGYDYAADIANAMKKTSDFIESHRNIVECILNGLNIAEIQRGHNNDAI